jgi:peptidyl-prolyl cis-trans isomerase C
MLSTRGAKDRMKFAKGDSYRRAALLIVVLLAWSVSLNAQDKLPSGVAAIVNGVAIPESAVEQNVKTNLDQGKKDTTELRRIIKEELINREILAQEATKRGLDKTPDAQIQFALYRKIYLVEALLNDYLKRHPVSDADLKAEYDRQMASLGDPNSVQQYKLSHIVLASETDARAVLTELRKGESFDKLAREKSINPSKENGGSLGWLLPGQVIPAISNVMVNLNKGGVSAAPIETSVGWQIIKVEDLRPYKAPSLDEVKNQIREALVQQRRLEYVKELVQSAQIIQ